MCNLLWQEPSAHFAALQSLEQEESGASWPRRGCAAVAAPGDRAPIIFDDRRRAQARAPAARALTAEHHGLRLGLGPDQGRAQ
ncbi:MAG: hypothetical protein MJH10_05280 [Epibacterium sp.]|nr:hypothetical protein [Epibacterium sp.]NQX72963.1 hypothetical protein [Epibacterium sp.]